MRTPDSAIVLISKIEDLELPDQNIIYNIDQEQREEFSQKMMENASRVMSDYYKNKHN